MPAPWPSSPLKLLSFKPSVSPWTQSSGTAQTKSSQSNTNGEGAIALLQGKEAVAQTGSQKTRALALPPLWAAHLSCPDLSFRFGQKTLTLEACSERQGWDRPMLAMKWPAYGLQALLPNPGLWAWVWLWVRMGPGPLAEQWFLATSLSVAPPPSPLHVTKYSQS